MFFLTPEKFFRIGIFLHLLTKFIGRKRTYLFQTNDCNIITFAFLTFFIESKIMFSTGEEKTFDFLRLKFNLQDRTMIEEEKRREWNLLSRYYRIRPVEMKYHQTFRIGLKHNPDDEVRSLVQQQLKVYGNYVSSTREKFVREDCVIC